MTILPLCKFTFSLVPVMCLLISSVAKSTGIPVTNLLKGERERLMHMEEAMQQRVVGQDPVVKAVADAVRLSRAGLQSPSRPLASFLFLGPTGVGKSELAKTLAEFLFADEKRAL